MTEPEYTEDGEIILPPNVLIFKSNIKKPQLIMMDFTVLQKKKEDNFFPDIIDEMKKLFSISPFFKNEDDNDGS